MMKTGKAELDFTGAVIDLRCRTCREDERSGLRGGGEVRLATSSS
jgi:hypothetical protein